MKIRYVTVQPLVYIFKYLSKPTKQGTCDAQQHGTCDAQQHGTCDDSSMEHTFRASGLASSYILLHNDTNVSERNRITARYAYVIVNEAVCKITVSNLS